MTFEKEITCIVCPVGCKIKILVDGKTCKIDGTRCKRGIQYGKNEVLDPRRMLTSSVIVNNGNWPLVSVKTSKPVPKDKIFIVLDEIKKMVVSAPIFCGQVLKRDIAGTGIDLISTKTIELI